MDTEQSQAYTQRSIRISALMGDPLAPFALPQLQEPFSQNQTAKIPMKAQVMCNRPNPFLNYQQPKESVKLVGGHDGQPNRDSPESANIGLVQVHILQP